MSELKTPPHSLEAEKSILGSMLISHTAVEQAMETLSASDFYLARHQDIFQAIKGIYDRGEAIDSVTVIDALDRMGRLAEEVNARLDGGTAEAGGEEDNGGAGDGSLLAVDGYWGEKTTLALQEYFGCPWKDGVISGQWSGDAWRHEACTSFEHDCSGDGSPTVQRMQQRLGVTPDGLCGQDTINALIRRYQAASGATALDGKLDAGSITVKAMQRALNEGSF